MSDDATLPGDGMADQRARTSLAWSRTVLGVVVVAALVTRQAHLHAAPSPVELVPCVLAAVAGMVALGRTRVLTGASRPTAGGQVATVSAVVVGLAVVAAVLVV